MRHNEGVGFLTPFHALCFQGESGVVTATAGAWELESTPHPLTPIYILDSCHLEISADETRHQDCVCVCVKVGQ